MIIPNVWALYHSSELFDQPDTFDPDRYIASPLGFKKGVETDETMEMYRRFNESVFGYGRRACAGIHLASNSIELNVTRMIWAFEFLEATKCDGSGDKADSSHFVAVSNGIVLRAEKERWTVCFLASYNGPSTIQNDHPTSKFSAW
jgi:cytochrome P450